MEIKIHSYRYKIANSNVNSDTAKLKVALFFGKCEEEHLLTLLAPCLFAYA